MVEVAKTVLEFLIVFLIVYFGTYFLLKRLRNITGIKCLQTLNTWFLNIILML